MLAPGKIINASQTLINKMYKKASGTSVTLSNAAKSKLHGLTVYGKAVQNGTPTPSSPVPIEVVDGANVFDISQTIVQTNGTAVTLGNGSVRVYTTSNGIYKGAKAPLSLQAGKSYYGKVHVDYVSGVARVGFRRVSDNIFVGTSASNISQSGDYEFRLPNYDGTPVYLSIIVTWSTSASGDATFSNVMINAGTEVLPYIPYGSLGLKVNSTITPIDLQGNVLASLPDGTKDELMVDSAGHVELTKNVVTYTILGTESTYNSSDLGTYYRTVLRISYDDTEFISCYPTTSPVGWCNYAPFSTGYSVDSLKVCVSRGSGSNAHRTDVVLFAAVSSASAVLTAYTGAKIMYRTANPKVIDLGYIDMPQIENNSQISVVAATTPDIDVEYKKDLIYVSAYN